MANELAVAEKKDLLRCENIIAKGMGTFVEVGQALARIRDGRLYRASHRTFEAYCQDKWKRTSRWAELTIESAGVASKCEKISQKPKAAQARALAKAPPEKQADIWRDVVENAGKNGEKVTAAKVERAVSRISGGTSFDPKELEAAQPPRPKRKPPQGRPTVSTQLRERAQKGFAALCRDLNAMGVYDQHLGCLNQIQEAIRKA